MATRTRHWLLLFTATVAGATATPASVAGSDLPAESLRELSQAYAIIRQHYVDEVDDEKLLRDAIRGMVRGLDPYSIYIDKEQMASFNNSLQGNFGGVGVFIDIDRNIIRVVSPIDNSPASRSGLQANDYVVRIDGLTTENMAVAEAATLMRGVPGTLVTLSIVRLTDSAREDFDVELERQVIESPSVSSALTDDGFGFLRISQFLYIDRTPAEVAEHLDQLIKDNGGDLKGLVIDLRNNPGGDLQSSICIASMFLNQGLTVVTNRGRNEVISEHKSDLNNCHAPRTISQTRKLNIAVLVNNGSASASEILAGALQDNDRGVIVGTSTFGKASVQRIYNLEATNHQSAIKLTAAHYFTPSGKSIHKTGIQPNVEIEFILPEPLVSDRDAVTAAELSNLTELETKNLPVLPRDNQFHKALEVLRSS